MKYINKPRGFTLTEIMITISVIAILASFIAPNINNSVKQRKVVDIIQTIEPIKKRIALQIAETETVTGSGTATGSVPASMGNNISSITVGNDGDITVVGTPAIESINLVFTPVYSTATGLITWNCLVSNSDHNNFVPNSCKNFS